MTSPLLDDETQDLERERAIVRAVIGRIAAARRLTPPWPHHEVELPAWLETADVTGWGVVELGDMRLRLANKRRRERHGQVYTPVEVVDFMVRSSLQAARLDRYAGRVDALEHITIVDPMCGCGIYPVRAARYIARWYAVQLAGPEPPDWLTKAVLPTVFTECIYGIDLDPVAVDVARAACWLEIGGLRPATFMDDNLIVADTFAEDLPVRAPKLAARWPALREARLVDGGES